MQQDDSKHGKLPVRLFGRDVFHPTKAQLLNDLTGKDWLNKWYDPAVVQALAPNDFAKLQKENGASAKVEIAIQQWIQLVPDGNHPLLPAQIIQCVHDWQLTKILNAQAWTKLTCSSSLDLCLLVHVILG